MDSTLRWRLILTLLVVILGLAWALPSVPGVKQSPLGKVLPDDTIKLGLDLKGGIYLTLEVDTDKAIVTKLGGLSEDLKVYAEKEGVGFINPKVLPGKAIQFNLLDPSKKQVMDDILKDRFDFFDATFQAQPSGEIAYVLALSQSYLDKHVEDTLRQTVDIVRNRIDRRGVVEPDIRMQEGNRIQIQLPGMEDSHEAIEVITKMGQLEFKMQDSSITVEEARKRPLEYEIGYEIDNPQQPIVLRKNAALTGEHISDAEPTFDQRGNPSVGLEFDSIGADIFREVTEKNVGRRMAIILDGVVYSAPVIQERIGGGRASITGKFTVQQAQDLVTVLKDALPAPVEKAAESTIGPTLGQESIDKGIRSAMIGGIAILLFMVIYYGMAGLFADTVLVLNIVLIMAGLAAFGATLTLPGIAGIILTIGMAVDANVIVFERIREELRRGLSPRMAVQEGFSRATLTIMDANVTTIIAAVILYQFGTGPIRGFAVTLTLGILTSMFTAIFVSRIMFDLYTAKRAPGAKLSI